MTETESLADTIALLIHEATAPLHAKIAALEARPYSSTPDFVHVLTETVKDLQVRLTVAESRAPIPGPAGKDGTNAVPIDVDGLTLAIENRIAPKVVREVESAVARIEKPKDGLPGLNGKDGTSVSVGDLAPMIAIEVRQAVAAIPIPRNGEDGKNGTSVTLDDVVPLITASVTKAFDAMPKPKDGLGVKSAVVNNDGRLLITMSDDAVMDLGTVVGQKGRDGMPAIGRPGMDGTSVTLSDVEPMVRAELARVVSMIPKPKDGTNGIDGKDGLGLEDVDLVFEDAKGWLFRFKNESRQKDIAIPLPFDAGVWQAGTWYPQGAGVTVKGAFFIARERTRTRPDDGTAESAKAWRLAVKGGRDGKPGTNGKDGKDWSEE